jgi:hypothetical protein
VGVPRWGGAGDEAEGEAVAHGDTGVGGREAGAEGVEAAMGGGGEAAGGGRRHGNVSQAASPTLFLTRVEVRPFVLSLGSDPDT